MRDVDPGNVARTTCIKSRAVEYSGRNLALKASRANTCVAFRKSLEQFLIYPEGARREENVMARIEQDIT